MGEPAAQRNEDFFCSRWGTNTERGAECPSRLLLPSVATSLSRPPALRGPAGARRAAPRLAGSSRGCVQPAKQSAHHARSNQPDTGASLRGRSPEDARAPTEGRSSARSARAPSSLFSSSHGSPRTDEGRDPTDRGRAPSECAPVNPTRSEDDARSPSRSTCSANRCRGARCSPTRLLRRTHEDLGVSNRDRASVGAHAAWPLPNRDQAATSVVVPTATSISGAAGSGESTRHALDGSLGPRYRHPRNAGRRLDRLFGVTRLHPHADLGSRFAISSRACRHARVHRRRLISTRRRILLRGDETCDGIRNRRRQ